MDSLLLKSIIISIVILTVLYGVYEYIRFKKLERMYGKKTTIQMFKKIIRGLKPFVPGIESKRYKTTEILLDTVGWNIGVEYYYLIKILIFSVITSLLFGITLTNNSISVKDVISNLNLGRSVTSSTIKSTDELQELEYTLYELVRLKIDKGIISTVDDAALEIATYYQGYGIESSESIQETAQRIYNKVLLVKSIHENPFAYIQILVLAFIGSMIPDMLAYIKIMLLENTKNWDAIYSMVIYSIFGKLPPYRVDTVISNIETSTHFYRRKMKQFKPILDKGDHDHISDFIKSIRNDDMEEVLEMLYISSRTGLLETVRDVEDMYNASIDWMDINSKKRRQVKYSICLIPLSIIFFLLILYFQYGLTAMMGTGITF